jgi:hypothetical protein
MKRPVGITAVMYHRAVTGACDCCRRSSLTQMRLHTVVAIMPMADTEIGNLGAKDRQARCTAPQSWPQRACSDRRRLAAGGSNAAAARPCCV